MKLLIHFEAYFVLRLYAIEAENMVFTYFSIPSARHKASYTFIQPCYGF